MTDITVIAVGGLKEGFFKEACAEYQKRLGAYCRLNVVELSDVRLPAKPSEGEIKKTLEKEGGEILSKLPAKAAVIALCIEGRGMSSEELAEYIRRSENSGVSSFAFIIGSSYGLSDEVKKRADIKLSMSKMTFPHRLARVMLLEQVYRAFSILSNGKYHK